MRIGLTPGGDLAQRISRVLLADPRVAQLGVPQPTQAEPRTVALGDIDADVAVATDLKHEYVQEARNAGIPIIAAGNAPNTLSGDLASIAHALKSQLAGAEHVSAAWTTMQDTLRDGSIVTFPAPLGHHFGYETNEGTVVPVSGPWAGVLVQSKINGVTRSVSVVDDARYLDAIALAARAMAVSEGETVPGPGYLRELSAAGLEFAVTSVKR